MQETEKCPKDPSQNEWEKLYGLTSVCARTRIIAHIVRHKVGKFLILDIEVDRCPLSTVYVKRVVIEVVRQTVFVPQLIV